MRRLLLWTLVATFIFAMVACGSDDSDEQAVDGDDSEDTDGDDAVDGDADEAVDGDDEVDGDEDGLPDSLPFELTRDDVGTPPTDLEIAEFTKRLTGFWKDSGYFDWVWWTSHGIHKSFDENMPDYKLYWQDTRASKSGDTVTFSHYGGADNIMIRTPKILNNAAAAYLMSGDMKFGRIVEQYSKGIVALFLGMVFSEDDDVTSIMARSIFTRNHEYEMEGGRKVAIDYDPVKVEKYDWNAHTIPNVDNPHWGNIWVRNMRSKDDVPHIFRCYPMLKHVVAYAKDENVRAAAAEAVAYLKAFAKDIVDEGYYIRTKDKDGTPYVPMSEEMEGIVNDLASFVNFEEFIPNAECNAKLASALMAYEEPLENDCEQGFGGHFETLATAQHYFNRAIIRYFHLAAISNSLILGYNDTAAELLDGLVIRADEVVHDEENPKKNDRWNGDVATFLVASATNGLPLTSEEAHIIHERIGDAADALKAWPNWDLWDASVPDTPDGEEIAFKPSEMEEAWFIRPEEMAFVLEYCYSPWKNPAGAKFVDCEIVADPDRWGE